MTTNDIYITKWRHKASMGNISVGSILTNLSNLHTQAWKPTQTEIPNTKKSIRSASLEKFLRFKISSKVWYWLAIFPITTIAIWSLTYILFGNLALPGGSVFALATLELFAILLGHLAKFVYLPPAFGMIVAGLLLRNFPAISFIGNDLDATMTNPLRAMSVVVLLARGAFAVNPALIIKHKFVIPPLYIGSCVFQACAGGVAAYYIAGLPPAFAGAVGCIISAMSGGIVMPYLLNLEKRGLGMEHGVMAIAKQASGLDAILAISMTELAFGFIFANGDLLGGLQKGALEVVYGFLFGMAWGLLGGLFQEEHGSALRSFIVFAGGSMSLLGLTTIGRPRGGPVGCFFGALVTACIWRYKNSDSNVKVVTNLTNLWYFFEPLLFGIIGSRVDLSTVNWDTIYLAFLCYAISLCVRMCATFVMLSFAAGMTVKEKLFIVIAWLPKGTVQAALGPVALETASAIGFDAGTLPYDIMCVSVLVIVLGSFVGPILLLAFAPKLLEENRINNVPSELA